MVIELCEGRKDVAITLGMNPKTEVNIIERDAEILLI